MLKVRIQNFSGPYSVQMRENTDQKYSKQGHFLRSVHNDVKKIYIEENLHRLCLVQEIEAAIRGVL